MKNLFLLASLATISSLSISCGTIGGLGKDIQSVGKSLESTQNRRIFPTKASATQAAQTNALNSLNNATPTVPGLQY